ncbi:hypothetical protein N7468_010601 [Penicillium chermesinum]|uniref:Uncharacterized protein n=1 Tax=Penicillium chermesinum TaxID=63820 RepID=A0A9W9T9V7_9EURO|nr:uncharacterized protein N7468_010601 [Penicillium chermesinum]KAJ5214922.1 hypothetical protein N7468_010601 [Penicillium chermesinum]KAJ6141574.1 hypothetical protein N7470_009964 [Penicillium chermesinum]
MPSHVSDTPASPSIPETATVSTTTSSPQTLSKYKRGRSDLSLSQAEDFSPSGGVFQFFGHLVRYGRWRKRGRKPSQDDGRNVRPRQESPPRLPELALDEQKIELPATQTFDPITAQTKS